MIYTAKLQSMEDRKPMQLLGFLELWKYAGGASEEIRRRIYHLPLRVLLLCKEES